MSRNISAEQLVITQQKKPDDSVLEIFQQKVSNNSGFIFANIPCSWSDYGLLFFAALLQLVI